MPAQATALVPFLAEYASQRFMNDSCLGIVSTVYHFGLTNCTFPKKLIYQISCVNHINLVFSLMIRIIQKPVNSCLSIPTSIVQRMLFSSRTFLDTIDSSSASKATSLSDLPSSIYGITYFWWVLSCHIFCSRADTDDSTSQSLLGFTDNHLNSLHGNCMNISTTVFVLFSITAHGMSLLYDCQGSGESFFWKHTFSPDFSSAYGLVGTP